MARTTISIPDDLKAEMDSLGENVNWSATAATAFRAEIRRQYLRRAQLEGEKMEQAIERLRASKLEFEKLAGERGRAAGVRWAQQFADYADLRKLSSERQHLKFKHDNSQDGDFAFEVWACGLGCPGYDPKSESVALTGYDQDAFSRFVHVVGFENSGAGDLDFNSAEFWQSFCEGALEIYRKIT